jgi:hypothetical protein
MAEQSGEKMLTKDEMEIVDVFRADLMGVYTIRALMKETGRKTYTWTFNTVKKLAKMGVIKMETKGKAQLCTINLRSQAAISYLSLLDRVETGSKKIPHLDELLDEIRTPFFTFLVGGSYAEGKQTARSDLDLCVIVDDSCDPKPIRNALGNKLMIPRPHAFVFRKSEFIDMLLNREANYGKEIFKKHLIAFGADSYYLIIREAMEHGFRY